MQTRTQLFIALIIAMVVLLAFTWYEWSAWQNISAVPAQTASTTTAATSTTSTTSASSQVPLSSSQYPTAVLGEQQGIVTIDDKTIYVDLDVTPAQQELGLGNRAGIGPDQGMLFIFPQAQINMFWMKDMSFSIDMIWMSDDGTIIYIQPNVAPSTYPDAFGPNEDSRYVLEVPANFAANNNIKVGDKATLPQ